jgi:hypothetical protein
MDEAEESLRYDLWIEEALRAVIRRALAHAVSEGLPGDHHFYITFRTGDDGVGLPRYLKAQYPEEMTIVLQHQYRDLRVDDDGFQVTLRFRGKPERLTVPFKTVTAFHDPSVNFGLQLKTVPAGGAGGADAASGIEAPVGAEPSEAAPLPGPANVVALDAFRRK